MFLLKTVAVHHGSQPNILWISHVSWLLHDPPIKFSVIRQSPHQCVVKTKLVSPSRATLSSPLSCHTSKY